MSINKTYPDNWVIVKLPNLENEYKLVMGWSGGYLWGNSWRVNSGIKEVIEYEDDLLFKGYSGSEYWCRKTGEGIRANILHIVQAFEDGGGKIVLYNEYKKKCEAKGNEWCWTHNREGKECE